MALPLRSTTFVARITYRQRRLRDAARFLPIVGLVLMLLSLLWPKGEGGTAQIIIYLFGVWVLLIVLAAVLAKFIDLNDPENPVSASADQPTDAD